MKRLAVKPELCTGCRRCEEVCSVTWRKAKNAQKSAVKISGNGEQGYNINVCNQCGICITVCQAKSISRDKNGVVKIKNTDCVGCLTCVGNCPTETMFYHDELLEPFKCTACGICTRECPTQALKIEDY
ncbi:MAG: 4Fe-4S binding protein [Bacillota bacterium]